VRKHYDAKMERKFSLVFVSLVLLLTGLSPSFAQEKLKEGSECKKSGDKKVVSSKTIVCSNTIYGLRYVQLRKSPSSKSDYKKQLTDYINTLNGFDFNSVQVFIQNKNSVIAENSNPNTQLIDLNNQLGNAKNDLSQFESRIPQLPGLIENENAVIANMKSQMKTHENNMNAIKPQLQILSSQYGSAYQAKASYLSCTVLRDFGKISGPCTYNSYNDQIISQYNAYSSTYNSYYNQWKSLSDQVNQSNSKVNNFKNEKSNTKQFLKDKKWLVKELEKQIGAINGGTSLKQVKVNSIPIIESNLPGLIDRRNILIAEIQSEIDKPSSDWQKKSIKIYKKIKVLMFDYNETQRVMSY
jgi:chromosome segregation ATPase